MTIQLLKNFRRKSQSKMWKGAGAQIRIVLRIVDGGIISARNPIPRACFGVPNIYSAYSLAFLRNEDSDIALFHSFFKKFE